MAVAGLYRRVLPCPPAIEFASPDGKRLFSEALQSGTMEGFFRLISYFQTQSEPAYCGLASLSVVLNALSIDPGRKWKGPWRWFDESMLDCCEPLEKVKADGITFGKVACLAHCAGAKVEAYRANQSSLDDFRKQLIKCTASEDCHLIASYHRRPFKQTGTGHFSPIGGYHVGKDMALILDVARFKYPPHWVPLSLLWEAINTVDDATGLHRGFMLISRLSRAPSLLYTLSCRDENWVKVAKYLREDVPYLVRSETVNSVQGLFSILFRALPASAGDFLKWVVEVRRKEEGESSLSPEENERLGLKEDVLCQVRGTRLFKLIRDLLSDPCCSYTESTSPTASTLREVVATACCQGAALLTGTPHAMDQKMSCCKETCVKSAQSNGDRTIVSGRVMVSGGNTQEVDLLVPVSGKPGWCGSDPDSCIVKYPASTDVLTVLLLALPPSTWSGVRDQKVLDELQDLVAMASLPELLQLEEKAKELLQDPVNEGEEQIAIFRRAAAKKSNSRDWGFGSNYEDSMPTSLRSRLICSSTTSVVIVEAMEERNLEFTRLLEDQNAKFKEEIDKRDKIIDGYEARFSALAADTASKQTSMQTMINQLFGMWGIRAPIYQGHGFVSQSFQGAVSQGLLSNVGMQMPFCQGQVFMPSPGQGAMGVNVQSFQDNNAQSFGQSLGVQVSGFQMPFPTTQGLQALLAQASTGEANMDQFCGEQTRNS